MQLSFALSIAILAFALYVPGFLLIRTMRFSNTASIAAAPLVTAAIYSIEAIIFAKLGIPCSFVSICIPVLIVAAALYAVSNRKAKQIDIVFETSMKMLGAFIGCGIAASTIFYLLPLGTLDAIVCSNDAVHHLNLTMSFTQSGNWSTLEATLFPGEPGEFYPSLWSLLCALPVSLAGAEVPVAANALNMVILGLVLPSGMFLLASSIFKEERIAIICCAFLTLSFFGFPWELLFRETQLYPNLLALALLPGFLALFHEFFSKGIARNCRVRIFAVAFVGFMAVAFAHPNAVFTALFFMYACLLKTVFIWVRDNKPQNKLPLAIAAAVGITAAFAAFWILCFNIPFFNSIVTYGYTPTRTPIQALLNVAAQRSHHLGAQFPLGVLLACGCVSCLLNSKRRWLLIPFLLAVICYVCNATLPAGTIRNAISGFWYNHPTRTFASVSFFAIPIASAGAQAIILFIAKQVDRIRKEKGEDADANSGLGISPVLLAALLGIMTVAVYALPLPLPAAASGFDLFAKIKAIHNPADETSFYTQDERDFMDKVAEETNGARVLNVPNDGSAFAYSVNHVNVAGRNFFNREESDAFQMAQVINKIGTDQDARDLIDEMGIEYVVLLDSKKNDSRTIYENRYKGKQWSHMFAINENTPGFKLVLSNDDMRLYRIV